MGIMLISEIILSKTLRERFIVAPPIIFKSSHEAINETQRLSKIHVKIVRINQ
jgi:hypothetical protein